MEYYLICVICGELMQRYNLKNAMSSIWGFIFQLFLFLKAYFQNILASDGIREGVRILLFGKGRSYSVLSIQKLLLRPNHVKKILYL